MTNIHQLICQVRFGLEQLSARDAHHDFEHICRHIARARICSNILPATGPVAAGGDQGRDFETFTSYLKANPIANTTTFVGLLQDENPLAFACTIQRAGIKGKVQSDIKKISESGTQVQGVYFFCTADVPVALRHDLQTWAIKNYALNLEVFDGQAISELIVDREIFWIAEQFLGIPAAVFPPLPEDDSNRWYYALYKHWEEKLGGRKNYADFSDIKAAIRFATFQDQYKKDIPFWVQVLRTFIDEGYDSILQRRAFYEISVATLRGMGYLNGLEEELREYITDTFKENNVYDIEDTSILLTYCAGARRHNVVDLSLNELKIWREQLKAILDARVNKEKSIGTKAYCLEIKGYFFLTEAVFMEEGDASVYDYIEQAIKVWSEAIEYIKGAPLFPLERFADRLTDFIDLYGDCPGLQELCNKVDELLSDRFGGFSAAEKCKERALKFHEKGKMLRAINELHNAKVKWFAEETLKGSLLAILLLSNWYLYLGLSYAAKHYALAAAFIAEKSKDNTIKTFVPRALFSALSCDYYQGNWLSNIENAKIAQISHDLYAKQPWDFQAHEELQHFYFNSAMILTLAERFDNNLFEYCSNQINEWPVKDDIYELLEMSREQLRDISVPELWKKLEEQAGDRPFSDVGAIRKSQWLQLGIHWRFSWKNDFITTAVAEQFVAGLQIFLADISTTELCLLPTTAEIDIECNDNIKMVIRSLPSNSERRWIFSIPLKRGKDYDIRKQVEAEVLTAALSILREVSLLTDKSFRKALDKSFEQGLTSKVFVGQPYEILFKEFYASDDFEKALREERVTPELERDFKLREPSPELAWNNEPGPTYNAEEAKMLLLARYTNSIKPIRITLGRLLSQPNFCEAVQQLRNEGWRDWHILAAVASTTVNARVNTDPNAQKDIEYMTHLFNKLMFEDESADWPAIPNSIYAINRLRDAIHLNMLSTLRGIGLECHQETPDINAIETFLSQRYNFKSDDIEHVNYFPGI